MNINLNFKNIGVTRNSESKVDAYFSADIETDGPIPGPYSMLSFGIVYAGSFDGNVFVRPSNYDCAFYRTVKPISEKFDPQALRINGLDREYLKLSGDLPQIAMMDAYRWIREVAGDREPVLVAYPLSFDWSWLYWYFMNFLDEGSPFKHSRCFDIKTAFAVKARVPVSEAGMANLPNHLASRKLHKHHALDDAVEQAEIFANVFEWGTEGV